MADGAGASGSGSGSGGAGRGDEEARARTQKYVDKALARDPKVKFILDAMEKSGCSVDVTGGESFFKVEHCEAEIAGGKSETRPTGPRVSRSPRPCASAVPISFLSHALWRLCTH